MTVELRVMQDGESILLYVFKTIAEASEMILFLSDFLPDAKFVLQPATH
ncbi:hypothetical protein [Rhodovulum sp. P5]|nr:hypothetical protein [Rhodovulum sp. P5]